MHEEGSNHPRQCSLCGTDLDNPLPAHADYVTGADIVDVETQEQYIAYVHTDETEARLDELDEAFPNRDRSALEAEAASPDADKTRQAPLGKRTRIEDPTILEDNVAASSALDANDAADVEYVEDLSMSIRRAIDEGHVSPGPTTETFAHEAVDFSIDTDLFDKREVDSPSVIDDPEVAYVEVEETEVERQKTATICPDCYDAETHDVIWGVHDE